MQVEALFSDAEIEQVKATFTEEDHLRQSTATTIAGVSLALGVVGNLFFYRSLPGLNLLLYVVILVNVACALLLYFKRPLAVKHLAFAVPAIVFAACLAVNTAPPLLFFNLLLVAGSLFIMTRFASTERFLGGQWYLPFVAGIETMLIGWLEGPLTILLESNRWYGQQGLDHQKLATLKAVLRGLVLTVPIILLFALLLSSADAIFADLLRDGFSWLHLDSAQSLIAQALLIGMFTWGCMTGFKLMLLGSLTNVHGYEVNMNVLTEKYKPSFRLSMIETSMIMGSVDLLFLAFVIVQARYLFGGETNITAQGYTYAEYARRGFFELLAVSCITMLLTVALDSCTQRKHDDRLFRALTIGLIALTSVILVAAFHRLELYENAYGFTRIRVMSGIFMIWLGLLFGALLAAILWHRRVIFWLGCILIAMGFVLTLNVINMDSFITRHNIARFEETGKLDVLYLLSLSDDAIPEIAPLLDNPALTDTQRTRLLTHLGERLYLLDRDHEQRGWLSYQVSKSRAWQALDHHRDELTPFLRAPVPSYQRY